MAALGCLFKKAVGSAQRTCCLVSPNVVVQLVGNSAASWETPEVFWAREFTPEEILWSPACKEPSCEGAWACVLFVIRISTKFPCVLLLDLWWAWCSLTQPDSSKFYLSTRSRCHSAEGEWNMVKPQILLLVTSPALLLPSEELGASHFRLSFPRCFAILSGKPAFSLVSPPAGR